MKDEGKPGGKTSAPGIHPPHHAPGGGFQVPWPLPPPDRRGGVLRWQWERIRKGTPDNPPPDAFPLATPNAAYPRAGGGELRATWVGHSSWLIQIDRFNLLLDPHFSERASPLRRMGPRRLVPPGLEMDRLPPIDVVIISHDHYDHLDRRTIERLFKKFGPGLRWVAPLGHAEWFRRIGIQATELDWWDELALESLEIRCLPAQHWTSRSPFDRFRRLWASWAIEAEGRKVYFGGDSGYFEGYAEIGRDAGPFELLLMPIGAYEPRWFMRPFHMNPEDAVRAYLRLGGEGLFAAMHWGTFRLTDEFPLEPPARILQAWAAAGLSPELLWVPRHGETRIV